MLNATTSTAARAAARLHRAPTSRGLRSPNHRTDHPSTTTATADAATTTMMRRSSSVGAEQPPSSSPPPSSDASSSRGGAGRGGRIEKYTSNEFPDRQEPPSITRTSASDVVSVVAKSRLGRTSSSTTSSHAARRPYVISPSRGIGPDRPSHVPPNVPPETLRAPDLEFTTLPNGCRPWEYCSTSAPVTRPTGIAGGGDGASSSSSSSSSTMTTTTSTSTNDGACERDDDEGISTSGVNHLMELLAFQSTRARTGEEVRDAMERLGGACFATSGREQMMYCVDVLRPNVGTAFGMLAETIKFPLIDDVEVEEMKRTMEYQMMDVSPQVLMGEGLQAAGYGPLSRGGGGEGVVRVQQLGRPHFCTPESLPNLTARSVHAFRERHLLNRPNGIVVSGSGISHDELVELADANFGHVVPRGGEEDDDDDDDDHRTVPSVYTGGEYRLERPPNPNPAKEEFAHVAVAFEVGGWHSSDLVPTCVLQTLLGGGSSFSAGGPGKGMYSRLYREVLNRHHWAESCEAFTSFHTESGLFGMAGSARPDRAGDMTRSLVDHFLKLEADPVSDEELDRARNMLKCNVLTQLESRLVLFEDIGRQILTYGKREDASTMCAKIDGVTKEDIQRVIRKAVRKPPTLSTVGIDIKNVPGVEEVTRWLGRGPQKKSWF
ncbi:hypothetical protein ACHAXA_009544 [Cyclostephanos tholiformis]|uniref:Mitochondrial processing peptidase alpha subunit n=1 Tax=Cyclostephanos tholiformis TaxID=382380 RepID=A0ABD3R5W3_9STRA